MKSGFKANALTIASLLWFAHTNLMAATPWELGIGLASIQSPDFRGSNENRNHLVPFPYVVYSNRYIKIDRDGIAGHLIKHERIKLDISGNAGVPVDSSENLARQGMPDLDPSLEIGPALDIKLLLSKKYNWLLSFPLRAALSTDFRHIKSQGWIFNPNIYVDRLNFGKRKKYNFSFSAGPVFATNKYHGFYYNVAPAYATIERPSYEASGGYSGFRTTFTFSRRYRQVWIGGFIRYDNLANSQYEDSPLINKHSSLMGGIALTYMISSSKTMGSSEKPSEGEKDTADVSANNDFLYSMKL